MWAYIFRRLLYVIPVLIGVTLLIFVLFNLVAGDPTLILLGKHASLKQMAELRHELGLDTPWFFQYLDILKSAFTLDFGRSWSTKQDIWTMVKNGAVPSMTLTLPAFIISTVFNEAAVTLIGKTRMIPIIGINKNSIKTEKLVSCSVSLSF